MDSIAFIDTEVDPKSLKILDIGAFRNDTGGFFHKSSLAEFISFLNGTEFICGHNIFNHDIKFIGNELSKAGINSGNIIDTLHLSPLLFPAKPYHALLKDDKLQTDDLNNPLNDAIKARDLFWDEVTAFQQRGNLMKQIFYGLLKHQKEFNAFFRFITYTATETDLEKLIRREYQDGICENAELSIFINEHKVELAYSLSLINSFIINKKTDSVTPPWVLRNYPDVERIMFLLRNKPCIQGCAYCNSTLDIHKGLKKFFGFNSYKSFDGVPLQQKAVKAAIDGKSFLAVFPTGGGKSITFQVPALINGESSGGLTIVISPLQSLMKDQIDNLEKNGITNAVTINGLLDPIERAKSLERVENGSASLLYIAPESLRSRTIEKAILGRKIVRFVIDEAHCFSSWGQDFRIDYLYIGKFIKSVQKKKNLDEAIPVSCFTATAKQKVIENISSYFREMLSIDLELFSTKTLRKNLKYQVIQKESEESKYQTTRELLEAKNCPTIIYVSRTRKAYLLAERLITDGFRARPYHGKMDIKEKSENQNAFISGEVPVMVATSAFGMGVDKKDVGMVIHYDISDSIENYIQEAGRAGRDENMTADCLILFNEEDLNKHFILLNRTKLSIKEIQQIWRAIKELTKFRSTISNSALEIARKAGWDDNVMEIESRVKTAISALEEAGYLRRGYNMPKIFANSILCRNAQEAIDRIMLSEKFDKKQKEQGIRIIKKLFSSKSRKHFNDEFPEARVDYISDHLGIVKEEVINIINLLREEKILADTKDLNAFIRKTESKNRSLKIVESFCRIENFLLTLFKEEEKNFHLKEINEEAEKKGCEDVSLKKIKTLINFWVIKNWIKKRNLEYSKNHIAVLNLYPPETLKKKLEKRHELAKFIVEYLYLKSNLEENTDEAKKDEALVEFSVHELKEQFEKRPMLFPIQISPDDVEDSLFYLSRIDAVRIEGGFLVIYNTLYIERLEQDNKRRYKAEDYEELNQFYENKVQQIHIVGEYAKKMITDYKDALQFVEDYFQLNYSSFLRKYFPGSRQNEINRTLTPAKFRQLFGGLSPAQLKIITDNSSKYIVVAAGPGSGKTKVLVHKLASLLLMEDVKHEQLLMLTFSRSAATEFKKRLIKLIGNAAGFIEIKTFHSYCFDLLGKIGTIEKSDEILKKAVEKIRNREIEANRITKTVLVIDEAQDMDKDEFMLINTLMEQNEEMRVIAAGDDDQNIFEFRGADSKYLKQLIERNKASKHELIENFRSKSNLVEFSNQFVKKISQRLKETPIISKQTENGKLKLVRYQSEDLIIPLIDDLESAELSGRTGVLTRTNEEAVKIAGLLLKRGFHAKLIQSNDGFSLNNLIEVRSFTELLNQTGDTPTISDEDWNEATRKLEGKFRYSSKLEICKNIIRDFKASSPTTKYKSDLEIFIRESKLEDFISSNPETVLVSTIHKAKGREFDNVFLMLENYIPSTDDEKRLIYVAMTRARNNLTIHINSDFLSRINAEDLIRINNMEAYEPPDELTIHCSFRDVWLDYFISKQNMISQLVSGEELKINGYECTNSGGKSILKFSQQFINQIDNLKEINYGLLSAKVNFIVYWLKEETKKEIKIILPEVHFKKTGVS